MKLSEYQAFMDGFGERMMDGQALAIHTGYWAAYYTNAGKKASPPHKQIEKLRGKVARKRVTASDDGMDEQIKRFEALERKRLNKEG